MIIINMFTCCKERRQSFWRKRDLFWFIHTEPVHRCTQCDHSDNLSVQFSNELNQSCSCQESKHETCHWVITSWTFCYHSVKASLLTSQSFGTISIHKIMSPPISNQSKVNECIIYSTLLNTIQTKVDHSIKVSLHTLRVKLIMI